MNIKQYEIIKAFCAKNLIRGFHNRHLEDITQHVAMEYFSNGYKGNWSWYFANYCRANGLSSNNRSKKTARTLEVSTFVGEDSWKLESKTKKSNQDDFLGLMDEFLLKLNLNKGAYKWSMKIQEQRLSQLQGFLR